MERLTPQNPVENLPPNPKDSIIFLEDGTEKFFSPISKKWYFVAPKIDELTTVRVEVLERRLIELAFSGDLSFVITSLRTAIDFTRNQNHFDTYATLQNLIISMNDLKKKKMMALIVCSVFIYEESENPWEYSDEHALRKIEAWQCFNSGFFLRLAASSLQVYNADLSAIFQEYFPNQEVAETVGKWTQAE